jgi:hypothetical protein
LACPLPPVIGPLVAMAADGRLASIDDIANLLWTD